MLGSKIGHAGWLAVVWCLGLAVFGYLWSTSKSNRDPNNSEHLQADSVVGVDVVLQERD